MRVITPLLLLLALSAPPAGAWPIIWDPSLWTAGSPDHLRDDFMGPRTAEQQKEYDAAKLAGQQSALSVGNPCVPWHPPCKLPEEGKPEDILKEGNAVNEDGWVKTKDGFLTPGGELIKKGDLRYASLPPVKAEEEQKRIEQEKKQGAKEYADANSRMWGGSQGGGSGGGFSLLSHSPAGGGQRTASAPNVGGVPAGGEVAQLEDDAGVRSVVDDVLAGQPEGSSLWSGDEGSGYGDGNVGLGQGLTSLSRSFTDNGDAVSVAGGSGGNTRTPSPHKTSAIGQLHKTGKPQPKGGFMSALTDWLTQAGQFDNMQAGSMPRVEEDPRYKQTAIFGTTPAKNAHGTAEY